MPPLGLAYLAGALSEENIPSEIWDLPLHRWSAGEFEERISRTDCRWFGITANVFTLRGAIDAAASIKRIKPDSIVVLGGPCTVFHAESILKRFGDIDFLALGEGEETIVKLSMHLAGEKDIQTVPGIAYRQGGQIVMNESAPLKSMDALPRPQRNLISDKRYRMHPPFNLYPPLALVETARGCPYHCNFCTINRNLRLRSPERVIEELDELSDKFGYNEIHFVDPTFTSDPSRIMAICEEILRCRLTLHWTCKTRPELISNEILSSMAKAGCYSISYGFESGDQTILDNLKKEITVEQIENAIDLTQKHGIRSLAYILIGSPGENEASLRSTISLVRRRGVDFALFGELLPDPSSELTLKAIERGEFTQEDVQKYYFDGDPGPFALKGLTGIERSVMIRWISRANRRFFFRPSYIFRSLLNLRNLRDLKNLVQGGLMLLLEKFQKKGTT